MRNDIVAFCDNELVLIAQRIRRRTHQSKQTFAPGGDVVQAPGTGTYTVNRDCTGIADLVGAGPHPFVIVDGGKQMDLMDINSAEVITIHFTKVEAGKNDHHED